MLLLDDKTKFVDYRDLQRVMEAVRSTVDMQGVTVLCVTHQLRCVQLCRCCC